MSERRHGTVVFADISGFTALSEKLDPEEVTGILNTCFERLEGIVLAHGGIIDEYLGDCIKAVFGFNPATADPTLHAVAAALEIREAVASFSREQQLPSPLDVHVGISTGPTVGIIMETGGETDFLVMGEAARLAARLEDVSSKGDIFVGPETYAATRGEFDYRAREPLPLDGQRTLPVYELLGRKLKRRLVRQSERRNATIVFADVLGFTALSEHAEPAALAEVMTACFAELRGAVAQHGGVIDKYMGDGLMALFGIPNAIEDAPKQAINAAIEMRARLARFGEERQLGLRLHVGINTGLVIAGEIGGRVKRDFSAIGDTVNLASRLKDASPPDAIYVGPETHRYTAGDFEYRALSPLSVKGKEHPVPAYQLASVTKQVHRANPGRSGRMVFSEMVGREAELELLRRELTALVAGRGGIVSVVGEPGMGKTRLVAEASSVAESLGVTLLQGRSLAIGETMSFHPFVDLLRRWAGIDDNEPEPRALAKLANAIAALVPDDASDVFPFVATLMGLRLTGPDADRLAGIEGDSLEKLIVRSVRELFQALGTRRPTVLVFEDLHWADRTSLNLLGALLPLMRRCALLFLHVLRPHFAETGERILRVARAQFAERHVEIQLQGLDERYSEAMVQSLLNVDDMPRPLRALIAEKAEGNPFYIEEVVRSLIDQGAVEHVEGRFRVTEKIDSVVIPGTIQDVIMTRVDRLDESKRQLLQLASVIGRSFYYRIVAAILEHEGLDDDLGQLKEMQLLIERRKHFDLVVGERSFAEELEYLFQHALAQETIYASLLHKTRRENHLRVAQTVETLFADRPSEFYGTLSYHYGRGEQLEKAEEYSFKAGEESARTGASREALRFFREAARLYAKLHDGGGDARRKEQLERNIGLALLNTGELTESIGHFDQALEHLGEPVPRSTLAIGSRFAVDLAAVLFHIYVRGGRHGGAQDVEHEREVCELYFHRGRAETTSDPRRVFLQLPTGLRRLNRIDPRQIDQACGMYVSCAGLFAYSGISFAISRRMIGIARSLVREDSVIDRFVYRMVEFIYHYLRGEWDARYVIEDELVEQDLRYGQFWDVTSYLGLDADQRARQGDFAGARRALAKLLEINDGYGYAFAGTTRDGQTAILLLEERSLDEALEAAEAYYAPRTEDALRVHALGLVAKAQVLRGEQEAAAASLATAEEAVQRSSVVSPWHQSGYLVARLLHEVTLLEASARRGGAGRSRTLAAAARRTAGRMLRVASRVAKDRTEAFALAGRLAWALGRHDRALVWLGKAIACGEHQGARPELARAYLAAGRCLSDGASRRRVLGGVEGGEYLRRAERLFEDLGLAWDLAQVRGDETAVRVASGA